jgi:hypothetical protein
MRAIRDSLMIIMPVVVGLSLLIIVANMPFAQTGAATQAAAVPVEEPESEFETLDPSAFSDSTTIDNRWFPLVPGTEYLYEGTTFEDGELSRHWLEFTVIDLVKEIDGVRTVAAWIVDYSDGEMVEKEVAFYAQDDGGNVWYLGEHPEEYEEGQFVTAPTWIHGVADAKAGVAMPADPQPGSPSFSQGWSPVVDFRDRGQATEVLEEMCTAIECYSDVLVIREFTLEEPGAAQLKYYAPGVGNIRVSWRGEDAQQEELELIGINQLGPEELTAIRAQALELEAHAYEISPEVYGQTEPMIATD